MFVIKPNRSMSWRGLVLAFACIAAVTLAVALFFWSQGFTLVLPFAGAELLVLGLALYATAHSGGTKQVITISSDAVRLESGRSSPESAYNFQRHWARIVLVKAGTDWYPSRLMIRSHGREVEVGHFLNEDERQGLAQELQLALAA